VISFAVNRVVNIAVLVLLTIVSVILLRIGASTVWILFICDIDMGIGDTF